MALAPRLDLRQSQSLVMTPQLQQAIKLLALSNMELEAFVGEELEKNPLLEMATEGGDAAPRAESPADLPTVETGDVDRLIAEGDSSTDAPLDADYAGETFIDDGPGDAVEAERSGP